MLPPTTALVFRGGNTGFDQKTVAKDYHAGRQIQWAAFSSTSIKLASTLPFVKKLNSKAIKSVPQVANDEQQSMGNIRAGKLQTYINEKVLPAYWSTESIRQRATKHAEKLNITDANEIDNIIQAMTEDAKQHESICVRTAQRWLNILGYTYRKNGKNGQFIDYNQRQVLFELRCFYPFHVAEESCILCC